MPEAQQLIYDWNTVEAPDRPSRPVAIHDETLRDGIQGPSVRDPDIDHKLHFLHLADELGVASIDLGLPGSGPRAMADVERLAAEIRDQRLHIKPLCAARTLEVDIRPVVEISQRVGIPIEVAAFIGSSPIRQYAEDGPSRRWSTTRARPSASPTRTSCRSCTSRKTRPERSRRRFAASSAPPSRRARSGSRSATPSVTPPRTARARWWATSGRCSTR